MLAVKFVEGTVLMYTDPQRSATPFPSPNQLQADADAQVLPSVPHTQLRDKYPNPHTLMF
jgi:hypothetical protein